MDKLFVVIKREFMERVRSKWFVIMTLLMPALMATMILLPAWLAIRSSASSNLNRFILIDATGAGLGKSLLGNLKLDSVGAMANDSLAPTRPDLRIVAPAYGALGFGFVIAFAAQGTGHVLWPFVASVARILIAAGCGWLAVGYFGAGMAGLSWMVAASLVAYAALCVIVMISPSVWRHAKR